MRRVILGLLVFSSAFALEGHRNEFSVGGAWTFITTEKESAPSVHLHYKRVIWGSFGAGISYEEVFDVHGHSVISALFSYRFEDPGIELSYMAGFYLKGGEGLVHHIEVVKTFPIGNFHLGPMLGYSFGEEEHLSVGLHIGFGF